MLVQTFPPSSLTRTLCCTPNNTGLVPLVRPRESALQTGYTGSVPPSNPGHTPRVGSSSDPCLCISEPPRLLAPCRASFGPGTLRAKCRLPCHHRRTRNHQRGDGNCGTRARPHRRNPRLRRCLGTPPHEAMPAEASHPLQKQGGVVTAGRWPRRLEMRRPRVYRSLAAGTRAAGPRPRGARPPPRAPGPRPRRRGRPGHA
mmetsp:Transcript_70411/g.198748  ORF Transcript_70411/g.198748 Transcript_70411/m.198748 type:complete len:201 (-) Transcript_70411:121-723(-)